LIKEQNSWHTSSSLSWAFSSFNWFNSASNSTVYACQSKSKKRKSYGTKREVINNILTRLWRQERLDTHKGKMHMQSLQYFSLLLLLPLDPMFKDKKATILYFKSLKSLIPLLQFHSVV